jgi:hypothetical protein
MKRHHQLFGFIFAAITVSAPSVRGQELPEALKEAQIKALRTGDISDLMPFSEQAEPIKIAASWTILASKQLATAKANVSRASALMTSEFIFRGANRFVSDENHKEKRALAEQNLQKFIAAEIELGMKENSQRPKIGEATFSKASFSLCPLFPFC